jgi:hypothetical protein
MVDVLADAVNLRAVAAGTISGLGNVMLLPPPPPVFGITITVEALSFSVT